MISDLHSIVALSGYIHNVWALFRSLLYPLPDYHISNRPNPCSTGDRVNCIWYCGHSQYMYSDIAQAVLSSLLFRSCINFCTWFRPRRIHWLTAEFRRQGFPSTLSRRCLLASALLLFTSSAIVYALDFDNQIANIKLGPFNADPATVSLVTRIWAPRAIFARINVSQNSP